MRFISSLILIIMLTGCSMNSKKDGLYYGVLPCADCPGIETIVVLQKDNYILYQKYLETDTQPYVNSGKIKWQGKTSSLALTNVKEGASNLYKVRADQLVMLDRLGKEVSGDLAKYYILKKLSK